MRYASVCDGIGAAHVAWQPLGWECAWTSEIEPFPAAVVDHHWRLKNLGDMTKLTEEMLGEHGPIDLVVGGTPCQSFSVAGLRGGLADPRGNLALRFLQLVGVLRPSWVVWENVPGVLSSEGGKDFGTFLGALAELGYGFAYRVLDAQWFGVAQRRRRVFVVGYLGDWRRAAAVLFERESVFGNPPTRGKAWQGTAARAQGGTGGGVIWRGGDQANSEHCADHAGTLNCDKGQQGGIIAEPYYIDRAAFNQGQNAQYEAQITQSGVAASMVARGPAAVAVAEPHAIYSNESRCDNIPPAGLSPPLKIGSDGGGNPPCIAFTKSKRAQSTTDDETWVPGEVSPTMSCFDQGDTRATTVVAFTQNCRDEVRQINGDGQIAGALAADSGSHQTNYVAYAIDGGNQAASEEVHHSLRTGRDSGDAVAFKPSHYTRGKDGAPSEVTAPLSADADKGDQDTVVAFAQNQLGEVRTNAEIMGTVNTNQNASGRNTPMVQQAMAVRRLTPKECERLQGFPDGYTDVTYRGKPSADGPRYRALGNSMAVPVMAWIGRRIQMVEDVRLSAQPQEKAEIRGSADADTRKQTEATDGPQA